jgi:glycosyltransferase involved in cell wall biosynthesis
MPVVSVVIPAFNYSDFLPFAVHSVIGQTFKDLEIIVVDDGSTDNTHDVVSAINDCRLQYHYQENSGLAAARNTGINIATGKYVGFLDADDTWLPNKLAQQLRLLEQDSNLGLVYGGYEIIDSQGEVQSKRQPRVVTGNLLTELVLGNYVAGSATTSIVRASVFGRAGVFDESLRAAEDWDMWLRIGRHFSFGVVNSTVAQIRVHQTNMTSDPYLMDRYLQIVLDKFYKRCGQDEKLLRLERHARSRARLVAGVFAIRRRNFSAARRLALKALMEDMSNFDAYILMGKSLLQRPNRTK